MNRIPVIAAILIAMTAPLQAQDEAAQSFFPVFNGRDFGGWTIHCDSKVAVLIRDDAIMLPADAPCRLVTDHAYQNYVLRYEYRRADDTPWQTNEIVRADAASAEPLTLDNSAGVTQFRHIRIKPLPGGPGWYPLDKGPGLDRWRSPKARPGRLRTEDTWQDFELRFSARYTGQGGFVIIRSQGGRCEKMRIKLGKDEDWLPGSIVRRCPALESTMVEGQWAYVEIRAVARKMQVSIDGRCVVDYVCRLQDWYAWGWLELANAPDGKVDFRDVEIKTICMEKQF